MYRLYCEKSELTIGQLFLLDACKKRVLTRFWYENLNSSPKYDVPLLYRIATGKHKFPPLNLIYELRDYVEPADWFYRENEDKNEPPVQKERYVKDITQSINYKKLQQLNSDKLLNEFCIENFGEKSQLYKVNFLHYLSGRNSISSVQICKLKKLFPANNWFLSEE